MSKELIVSVNGREKKIAILEDDLVTEFYVERGDENQGIVGNIYKGRVMKVLPGMQSAFVDIGLERDSFLYVSDFFDEEEFEEVGEERKEPAVARPPARQERGRQREAARVEPAVVTEADEEKEIDLKLAALSHIEEISEEPVVEPAPDDEMVGEGAGESRETSPRGRRQRRLRYPETRKVEAEEEEPAAATLPASVETVAEEEVEEEYGRRRRSRPRRRRNEPAEIVAVAPEIESQDEVEPVHPVEVVAEEEQIPSYLLVHHEPMERIVDEEAESIDGEMLKDAMLQERISGRIHGEERLTSYLEVEPTPEVHVGSMRDAFTKATEFERISDDSGEKGLEDEEDSSARVIPWTAESAKIEIEPNENLEGSEEAVHDQSEHGEVLHLKLDEAGTDEELKDAEAEIRQRNDQGEFATRRGGRGRRRGFRQRPGQTDATASAEEAEEDEKAPVKVEEVVAPPQPQVPRQSAERYQRPVISDLLREGQEIIVQIAKEPIGQKGARITSHIALPGRYIVYMPTVEHIGVSRKIGTDEERQRLKRTLHQLRAEAGVGGGFIVRTAANGCPLEELREDMQYLIRTWSDIRRRSERVKSPAIAHRDLDLVQRILRDQLSSDFTAIRVDNEFEYERMVDFVNRFAPKMVNRVKLYTKETPILEHYAVQAEIDKAVKPRVWLKSGGYIVINQTEALVAIDVNTGKFVGRSNRLEDTIVKTNLEAAKEIVRQIRLRDLGGIIVLDFIDMEERRNRQKVMQSLEAELSSDRSPSKILQFNDFGLVAITRKRVKQSLERTLCTPCSYCGGGGMVKSPQTVSYEILAESRRVSKEIDNHNEVILRVNPEVAKALRSTERDILTEIETYLGGVVTIKSDPTVHHEQFDIALA